MTEPNKTVLLPQNALPQTLLQIAQKYSPPLYVYDAAKIYQQITALNQAFSGAKLRIKYACKALSNIHLLRLLRKWGVEIEAVSEQEVALALFAGFLPAEILYTPSCVGFSEVATVHEQGVLVNIDDLNILRQFAQHYPSKTPCCLRLKPDILAGGNSQIQTGHANAKFGLPLTDLPKAIALVKDHGLKVIGLHVHTGSEIHDPQVFLQQVQALYQSAQFFPELEFLDLGGGFRVDYHKPDVSPLEIQELGQTICQSFENFCHNYGRPLELWIEPGKYLVSEAGYLLVETTTLKKTPASLLVGVNSGKNHLLRPALYQAYHRIVNLSNLQAPLQEYSVVGNMCESDHLAHHQQIAQVREGDILAICNAGAYGFSMSSNYNSRYRPAEVLLYQGKDYLIRRRETFEDLVQSQIGAGISENIDFFKFGGKNAK